MTSAATIRNGPTSAAKKIGTASAGAELHVKTREKDWVQFVDPSSGNTGWIRSSLLAAASAKGVDGSAVPKAANKVARKLRARPLGSYRGQEATPTCRRTKNFFRRESAARVCGVGGACFERDYCPPTSSPRSSQGVGLFSGAERTFTIFIVVGSGCWKVPSRIPCPLSQRSRA